MSLTRRWLRFAAGRLDVMVAASAFRRTLPVPTPLPVELSLDGQRYPVVDLETLAGLSSGESPPQLLLVFAQDAARLVIPATEVSGTLEVDPKDLAPLPWPYDPDAGWSAGVLATGESGSRPVLALELAGLAQTVVETEMLAGEVPR